MDLEQKIEFLEKVLVNYPITNKMWFVDFSDCIFKAHFKLFEKIVLAEVRDAWDRKFKNEKWNVVWDGSQSYHYENFTTVSNTKLYFIIK